MQLPLAPDVLYRRLTLGIIRSQLLLHAPQHLALRELPGLLLSSERLFNHSDIQLRLGFGEPLNLIDIIFTSGRELAVAAADGHANTSSSVLISIRLRCSHQGRG